MKKIMMSVLLMPMMALATTWYVNGSSGSDYNSGTSQSSAKATIQAAIEASSAGDTILVAPGTYAPITTENKAITIRSTAGVSSTIIDGGGVAPCTVLCESMDNKATHSTILVGFTLRNGYVSGEWRGGAGTGGTFKNCIISDNVGYGYGAAGGCVASVVQNSLVCRNRYSDSGGWGGGALANCTDVFNCTIVNNVGYGVWDGDQANCIIYGNTSDVYVSYGNDGHNNYCLTGSLISSGVGNKSGDPVFVDAANGDYRLAAGSPCIDAGDNSYVTGDKDLAGNARIANGTVDIGCYEYGASPVGSSLSDGLWAYYPLDGNANDASGNGRDLTAVKNDPQPTTDRFGNANGAYEFNGNLAQSMDIYAENDAELQSSSVIGTFSFAFWFQTNSSYKDYGAGWAWNLGNYAVFPSHGGFYSDERGEGSGLGVKVGVDGIELVEHANFYMPTKLTYQTDIGNGWHHVAVTVEDSGCPRLYLDGAYVATGETSDRTRLFRPNVGGWQWGYYTGKVDGLMVYNRALSAVEVKALYEGQSTSATVKWSNEYHFIGDTARNFAVEGSILHINPFGKVFLAVRGSGTLAFSARGSSDGFYYGYSGSWGGCYVRNSSDFKNYAITLTGKADEWHTIQWGTYAKGYIVDNAWGEIKGITWNGVAVSLDGVGSHSSSLAKGLVAFYPCGATTDDASGNGYNLSGSVRWTSDKNSSPSCAVLFDGTSFLTPSPSFEVSDSMTISAWVKPNGNVPSGCSESSSGNNVDLSNVDQFVIYPAHGGYSSSGKAGVGLAVGMNGIMVIEHANNYCPAPLVYMRNIGSTWTLVTVAIDNNGVPLLYVNGEYVRTGLTSAKAKFLGRSVFDDAVSTQIGGGRDGFFSGAMNDIRIYNRALSATEVKALYTGKPMTSFEPVTCTVTFDLNGADGAAPTGREVTHGAAIGSLPTPTREGYEFLGWYTAKSGGTQVSSSTAVTANAIYYAQWRVNSYTVTFNGNGADGATPAGRSVTHGAAVGALPTPSRTGYTFIGWFTAASGGSQISASTVVTGNVTYYAHWQAKTYTVTFNANGGNSSCSYSRTYGSQVGTLPTASRSGYVFKGWFTAASGGSQVSAATTVTGNATYYAHWATHAEEIAATLGTANVEFSTDSNAAWFPDGSAVRSGYISHNGSSTMSVKLYGSGLLSFRWKVSSEPEYDALTYSIDGIQGGRISGEQSWTSASILVAGAGWHTVRFTYGKDGGSTYGSDCGWVDSLTWTGSAPPVTNCKITFNLNGAVGTAPAGRSVVKGAQLGTLPVPTWSGYTFLGWYTAASGGAQVYASTKVTSNATYYAHWQKNSSGGGSGGGATPPAATYTVTFDGNGGSVDTPRVTRTAGSTIGSMPTPEAEGYEFLGWFTAKTGGAQVAATTKVTRNVTYYAHWQAVADENTLWDEDEAFDADAAAVFDGFLTKDGEVKGVIQVKVGKAKKNTGVAKISAKVTLLGSSGKLSYKGAFGKPGATDDDFAPGTATLKCAGQPDLELRLGRHALWGEMGRYDIEGARNVFAKSGDPKASVLTKWQGTYTLALETVDATGTGLAFTRGYSGLTVTVGAKGKVKVKGSTFTTGTIWFICLNLPEVKGEGEY